MDVKNERTIVYTLRDNEWIDRHLDEKTHLDALVGGGRNIRLRVAHFKVGYFDVIGWRRIDGHNSHVRVCVRVRVRVHVVSSQELAGPERGKEFADLFGPLYYGAFLTLDGHHVVAERIRKVRGVQ